MLTFTEFKNMRGFLQNRMDAASLELHKYPRGPMGLVPDEIRASEEYRLHKSAYDRAFQQLRRLNGVYVKLYAKELAAERQSRFKNKEAIPNGKP